MKIISWNVNGVRAAVKKNLVGNLKKYSPDIICLQETKAQVEEVAEALAKFKDYQLYSNSAERKGYAGTAILTRGMPINVLPDMGIPVHDQEGRILAVEFSTFYVVTVYVPNSGRGLVRLDYRKEWDDSFRQYLASLQRQKPVIICGDFNVAHQEIDIARPKSNYNKTAGYTQNEIDGFSEILDTGLIDTYRHRYPDKVEYTWWSYMFNARKKNIGWRIDYFLTSSNLMSAVQDSYMLTQVGGSDHCPIVLELDY